MLTGKQRAYLRGLANDMQPIFQIGKNGIESKIVLYKKSKKNPKIEIPVVKKK